MGGVNVITVYHRVRACGWTLEVNEHQDLLRKVDAVCHTDRFQTRNLPPENEDFWVGNESASVSVCRTERCNLWSSLPPNYPELCQSLWMRSLRHIRASTSNNTERVSVLNTQGPRKSIRINIWLAGETNAHFSFLTTSSVGLRLCHPDLRPQNKSSSDVFLIPTSDRVLWWSALLKPGQQPAEW